MKHFLFCLFISAVMAQPSPTTMEKLGQVKADLDTHLSQSIVAKLPLTNIGPSVMSGRVTDLDVNPESTYEFYVAYASGGLWYTNNNGTTFKPVMDNSITQNIGDFAVHWPSHTIYVGTGENNASRSSYSGVGILKSTDKGVSWEQIGLEDSHHIGKIEINPNNPDEVVVGVAGHLYSESNSRGIYKTLDGGNSWHQTLSLGNTTGIIDISVEPKNYKVQYAAAWEKDRKAWDFKEGGINSGIYKTIDAGNTWKLISRPNSGFPQGEGVGRIGISVFDNNILYAIVDNQYRRPNTSKKIKQLNKVDFEGISLEAFMAIDSKLLENFLEDNGFPKEYTANFIRNEVRNGKLNPSDISLFLSNANDDLFNTPVVGAQVYRSDDGGKTWNKTHENFIDDLYYSYGYYFGMIHISPKDDNHIYIYGVPILESKDGGKTFSSIGSPNVHADHHALWINPKNTKHIINGNDGGVNISYDGGKNWIKANQPSVGQFYTVYADNYSPYNVYGGLQDNGVWFAAKSSRESQLWHQSGHNAWTSVMGGDGMQIQVDKNNKDIIYTGYQFGNYYRINRETNQRAYIQPRHKLGEAPLRFNWQTPILLSPHNNDILYLGSNKLHRSLNRGDSWSSISDDLTSGVKEGNVPYGTLTAIDESRFQFGQLAVGSDDGHIHISTDSGSTWQRISEDLPQQLWVSRVQFSKHFQSRIYATLNGYRWDDFTPYTYVSDDLGKSWRSLSKGLPFSPVNVIREDHTNADILYIGTDNGLFVSIDRGLSWQMFDADFPRVAVHDLFIQERDNDLLIGTHGRSIYMLELEAIQALNALVLKGVGVVKPNPIKYSKNWGRKYRIWSETVSPNFSWVFYAHSPVKGSWQLKSDQGVVVYDKYVELAKGLQFITYDLNVSQGQVKKYNRKHKAKLKAADDGKTYLPKGNYTILWNDIPQTTLTIN